MVTRRDFLKTMSMASAGLALGTGDLLHAQTASPKKGRGDKVKIAYIGVFSNYHGDVYSGLWWECKSE